MSFFDRIRQFDNTFAANTTPANVFDVVKLKGHFWFKVALSLDVLLLAATVVLDFTVMSRGARWLGGIPVVGAILLVPAFAGLLEVANRKYFFELHGLPGDLDEKWSDENRKYYRIRVAAEKQVWNVSDIERAIEWYGTKAPTVDVSYGKPWAYFGLGVIAPLFLEYFRIKENSHEILPVLMVVTWLLVVGTLIYTGVSRGMKLRDRIREQKIEFLKKYKVEMS